MAGRLAGKQALMTGAGGLLGSDLARGFAAEGADLVLTTRSAAKLEPLAAEIRALGVRAGAVGCDFTRDDEIGAAVHLASDESAFTPASASMSMAGEPGVSCAP
jgi:short-subunit dehydrogenase